MVAVLQLNADYTPMRIISWQRAVCLVLDEKARLVEPYPGRRVRSSDLDLPWPAVVALTRYIHARPRVKFNRANVLARDRYTCQYCGFRPRAPDGTVRLDQLNIDHVVPRARSRDGRVRLPWSGETVPVTSWCNVVCACVRCNLAKANRTPEEAGMPLRALPRRPTPWDAVLLPLIRAHIPDAWKAHVPPAWRTYWDEELEGI